MNLNGILLANLSRSMVKCKNISLNRQQNIVISFKYRRPFMSVLSQKLQQASKLFQNHNFKKSLEAYEDCLFFCKKTDQVESITFNILSSKAALQYILGEYDAALSTLNSVLKKDPNHFLCLLRRSQVYKKKNKLKKALKDLQTICVYCPDNLQISAFRVEIEHMIIKHEQEHDISSSDEEEQAEELELNFIKLKQIDRKSIDITNTKDRKSRVSIMGDTTFEYKAEDSGDNIKDEENFRDKAIRTYREIEIDNDNVEDSAPIIKVKPPKTAKKSILKNKGTSIFILEQDSQARRSRYLGRESKLLTLIKSIDGKMISSAQNQNHFHPQKKQVQFFKSVSRELQVSVFDENDGQSIADSSKAPHSVKEKRKSCMKRSSFEIPDAKKVRRSKFQLMNSNKIDGHVIPSTERRRSMELKVETQLQQKIQEGTDKVKDDSESDDQSSIHNIFGNKPLVLSPQLKNQLGMEEDEDLGERPEPKAPVDRFKSKKSILKKNSVFVSAQPKKTSFQEPFHAAFGHTKSKKSVMFNCTM